MSAHAAFWLIGLFAFVAIVMAAAGRWRLQTKGGLATSHDNEDKIFQSAPYWANTLNQKLNTLIAGQRRLHQHIGSEADADYERDRSIMATIDDIVAKATEAKTVSASTNIAVREVLRLLREGQADPAKLEEAKALLEAMMADDAAMLTDNTPLEPSAE